MRFSALVIALAASISTVSAGCYNTGAQMSRDNVRYVVEPYCQHANGWYDKGETWKWCYRVMNSGDEPVHPDDHRHYRYVLFEFTRKGNGQDLSYGACQAYLKEIVKDCSQGGRYESSDGWSYRVDPGSSCDGHTPDFLEINHGIQI